MVAQRGKDEDVAERRDVVKDVVKAPRQACMPILQPQKLLQPQAGLWEEHTMKVNWAAH